MIARTAASLFLLLAVLKPAVAQQEVKLTISAGHPSIFLWVKHLGESFIPGVNRELAKGGAYRIAWTEAFGGTLAKLGSELETVEQGVSDLGIVIIPFHAAKLPLHNLSYVTPFGPTDPAVITKVMDRLHGELPALDQAWTRHNQVYLAGFGLEAYQLITTFPFAKVEDMRGRKIGSAATNTAWTKGSGAVGVVSTLPNMYNDMKAGVIDGIIMFATAAVPAKFYEVAPHFYQIDFGAVYGGAITVNRNRWERLPEPVRAALRAGAAAFKDQFHSDQNQRIAAAYQAWKDKGTVTTVAEPERIRFAKSIQNPVNDWMGEAQKGGRPARQALKAYMDALRAEGVEFARDWDRE